jgi:hypothetical protein
VGLFSVAPADDNSAGTELSGDGYARQPVTFGAPVTDSGNVRKVSNTSVIHFGPADVDWLQAVAFGIFSAIAGDLMYWDVIPLPKTVTQFDYGQFDIGELVVKED